MDILFGKLVKLIFESLEKDYFVYKLRIHGGEYANAVMRGSAIPNCTPPKALKTVEYELRGFWCQHRRYGKQFEIVYWKRAELKSSKDFEQMRLISQAKKALG